jgi:hypothetical protein
MKSKSIKGKSPEEIKSSLETSIEDGFKPTLAIVFLSMSQDRDAVTQLLDQHDINVFGATTNGEFIDGELEKESIVILLMDMDRSHFTIMFDEYPDRNFREVTQNIARNSLEHFQKPAFLIAGSKIGTDAEELLHGFEDVIGKHVNVYGGMAGDDFTFKDQHVFTNQKSSSQGIVVLAVDEDKIKIRGRAMCGWKAIGTVKTVTKSEGNHVFTVDNVPVLEMTKKYGGLEELTAENAMDEQAIQIATNFPLQLQREKGEPVMRPGLVIDWNDGSFYCSGNVPVGSKVRFSLPPDLDVIEEVISGAQKLKNEQMPEADALVVFSCGGRLWSMGPLMSKEIGGVHKVWDVPMAGFFTNAELALVQPMEISNNTAWLPAV